MDAIDRLIGNKLNSVEIKHSPGKVELRFGYTPDRKTLEPLERLEKAGIKVSVDARVIRTLDTLVSVYSALEVAEALSDVYKAIGLEVILLEALY